jgi:hypothetical protein
MIQRVGDIQALIVGCVFLWSGMWKLFSPQARAIVRRSALAQLIPNPRLVQFGYVVLGLCETVLALLLLLPPQRGWAMALAVLLAAGFEIYLGIASQIAPERPCACMGRQESGITGRTRARSALLLIYTLIGLAARDYWGSAFLAAPWLISLVIIEAAIFIELSPDIKAEWPHLRWRLYREIISRRYPDCNAVPISETIAVQRLRSTDAYRRLEEYLTAPTPIDRWQEGCLYFLAFSASYEDHASTAIFSQPAFFDPARVNGALVDDADNTLYLHVGSVEGEQQPFAVA